MGSWGITMRQSNYGLDLLRTIVNTKLKEAAFATFNVTDALKSIKADIIEEIRLTNRGCSAVDLVFYFNENFPNNCSQGGDNYYCTGELIVTEYVGEKYDPVEHH